MGLEILKTESQKVNMHTFTFRDKTGVFYYKEWEDGEGRVVDHVLRDKDGHEIDDPALLERVYDTLSEAFPLKK